MFLTFHPSGSAYITRESMHHLAVVAVVPGSELAGGLMDVVLRELWK